MLFLFCLVCLALPGVQAQDLITLRDGTDIEGKVLQVSPDEIKYKRADNSDGPLFVLPVEEVLMVRYANGTSQMFEQSTLPTEWDVQPGMRYRDYKNLYKPLICPKYPHNPALCGICSYFIPGLGQVIAGEINRGLAFFGGAMGCIMLMGVGFGMGNDEGNLLSVLGTMGWMTIEICAVSDAIRVAKIKNMYEQDLRRQAASVLDVKLQPYVSMVSTALSRTPVAGLSLAVAF